MAVHLSAVGGQGRVPGFARRRTALPSRDPITIPSVPGRSVIVDQNARITRVSSTDGPPLSVKIAGYAVHLPAVGGQGPVPAVARRRTALPGCGPITIPSVLVRRVTFEKNARITRVGSTDGPPLCVKRVGI